MFNEEEIKKWHDSVFEYAKEILKKEGHHAPIAIVMTEKRYLRSAESEHFKVVDSSFLDQVKGSPETYDDAVHKAQTLKSSALPSDQPVLITVPLFFTNKEKVGILVEFIKHEKLMPEINNLTALIQHLLQIGKEQFKVQDPYESVANAILKLTHIHEKDLQAFVLMKAISMTGAYAFCKIDEMWLRQGDLLPKGKDLIGDEIKKERQKAMDKMRQQGVSEDPDRIEGLGVQLETTQCQRLLFAEVIKEGGRDSETPVLGFGNTEEILFTEKEGHKPTGRFIGLLKRAEKFNPPVPKA